MSPSVTKLCCHPPQFNEQRRGRNKVDQWASVIGIYTAIFGWSVQAGRGSFQRDPAIT
jgi:hypothetical protein